MSKLIKLYEFDDGELYAGDGRYYLVVRFLDDFYPEKVCIYDWQSDDGAPDEHDSLIQSRDNWIFHNSFILPFDDRAEINWTAYNDCIRDYI